MSGVNVLNLKADPEALDPALAVEWAEEASRPAVRVNVLRRIKDHPDGVPRPWVFLGLRPAWPVRWAREQGEPCPGCQGRPLSFARACLICDRSGVDALLDAPPRPKAGGKAATGRAKVRTRAAMREGAVVKSSATDGAGRGTEGAPDVERQAEAGAGGFSSSSQNRFDLSEIRGKAG